MATAAGVFTMQDGRWHVTLPPGETIDFPSPPGPQTGDTVWIKGWKRGPFLVAHVSSKAAHLVNQDGSRPAGEWGAGRGWIEVPLACLTTEPPPPPPPAPPAPLPPEPAPPLWTPTAVVCAAAVTGLCFAAAGLAMHALAALLR